MISTSKVANIMDSKAIGRIIWADTVEVAGGIDRVVIVKKMVDEVAEMIVSIETRMILMRNANIFKNNLYFYPYRLQRLVNSKLQQ